MYAASPKTLYGVFLGTALDAGLVPKAATGKALRLTRLQTQDSATKTTAIATGIANMMQSFQLVWLDLTFACSLCYSPLSP